MPSILHKKEPVINVQKDYRLYVRDKKYSSR
jgi:hypothetical protein